MLSQDELKRNLSYNKDTGDFVWLRDVGKRGKAGFVAGYKNFGHSSRYKLVYINKTAYQCHRLAFLYMTGSFPKNQVDHIDGDGFNNRWDNLRDVSRTINQRNRKMNKNNTSGHCGVCFNKKAQKWISTIRFGGKGVHLGSFDDIDLAIKARKDAEKLYGYHKNHGRN